MQFNNKEILVFLCIKVHDGAVCLAVSDLMYTCSGSHRSCGLCVVAIWNHVGEVVVRSLFFVFFFHLIKVAEHSFQVSMPNSPLLLN